jgi:hypothetical protein
MDNRESWNWEAGEKALCDLASLRSKYAEVHESTVSPDGERFAVPVLDPGGTAKVSVNGQEWEGDFERAWSLCFTSDGRLVALVRIDDMWTVAVDGQTWEDSCDFVWNLKLSPDGKTIAVQLKRGMEYSLAVDGKPWEKNFISCRDFAFSPDGKRIAATVQVEPLPEADIFKFMEGTWSVAVDGVPWEEKFINAYTPAFSPDGNRVAAQVRMDICEYTLAVDGKPWDARFGCTWEPLYRPGGELVAPVRADGGWTLAQDGKPAWSGRYVQLWHPVSSPDGKSLAAIAATGYGRWTVVQDDVPWSESYADMVLPKPRFSPDGRRVAVVGKENDRWGFCVDGKRWSGDFDMAWDPVFSPDSSCVVAKVERNGSHRLVLDDNLWGPRFERLWDPVFSPDGQKLLVRGVFQGKYLRQVVPVETVKRG